MPRRPCLDCGTPASGSRCPPCTAAKTAERDARRGTTTQRGLGWAHQKARRAAIRAAGSPTSCPRCGREITKGNPITAEHGTARAHGGTEITEVMCRICNSSLGARVRRQ